MALVDLTSVTIGNLGCSSTITINSVPNGSGPWKSIAKYSHGLEGRVVGIIGVIMLPPLFSLQVGHSPQSCWIILSTPGNHTRSRRSFFVLHIPWCPSCANCAALSLELSGMTILLSLSMFSDMDNSFITCLYGPSSTNYAVPTELMCVKLGFLIVIYK
jgi:hypothetical protein